MRYRREDVVEQALALLATVGLPDLTMRRLGTEMGVQPSAIYHHFPSKQALLGAVADAIIESGEIEAPLTSRRWDRRAVELVERVRRAVLGYPDGADLVATMWAYGMGGQAPYVALRGELSATGLSGAMAGTAARTLLHYVYGHAIDEQAHAQASRLGAIDSPGRDASDFERGLQLIIGGIAQHLH